MRSKASLKNTAAMFNLDMVGRVKTDLPPNAKPKLLVLGMDSGKTMRRIPNWSRCRKNRNPRNCQDRSLNFLRSPRDPRPWNRQPNRSARRPNRYPVRFLQQREIRCRLSRPCRLFRPHRPLSASPSRNWMGLKVLALRERFVDRVDPQRKSRLPPCRRRVRLRQGLRRRPLVPFSPPRL